MRGGAYVQVRFWGTRGSVPAPGPRTARYGGNTSCVEILADDGTLIICDSGTGIRELGIDLVERQQETHGHVLLSHTHWDHIQGWPFFGPAFIRGNEFIIHALPGINRRLDEVLANQMEYTFFPVRLEDMGATIAFEQSREGNQRIGSAQISVHYLNHTSVCLAYRIEVDGKTVVYASDTEPHGLRVVPNATLMPNPGSPPRLVHEQDRSLADFVHGADLLIMDAQYTDEEYPKKVGWGHSTTSYAVDIGVLGRVARLAFYHHDPTHGDAVIDEIVASGRARVAAYGAEMKVFAAAEGMTIQLS
jgi:phosphoribosyl 1,2-cyclic phosphodiesterase